MTTEAAPFSNFECHKISILGEESIYVSSQLISSGFILHDLKTNVPGSSYVVITDTVVHSKWQGAFERMIPKPFHVYVLPDGESSKTRSHKSRLEDWMLQLRCDRKCVVVAIGGGVVGDLAGFTAATFMRGVRVVQVPTTLLAMVDSSIGGKTGVNAPAGKNLIGAFHQPTRIYLDPTVLGTLPRRQLCNGLAEVAKCAAIWDEQLFAFLEREADGLLAGDPAALMHVIARSAAIKAHVVTHDEKETLGLRALLNYGHTVGHAVEALMQPTLLHGECVSIGMVVEAEIARALGHLHNAGVGRLLRLLKTLALPVRIPAGLSVDDLMARMAVDKKNAAGCVRMVLLDAIGRTHALDALPVDPALIRLAVSPSCVVLPPPAVRASTQTSSSSSSPSPSPSPSSSTAASSPIDASLRVPGSKSLSNRALLLAALASGDCRLHGLLHSDDTMVMMDALQRLGCASFQWEDNARVLHVSGGGGRIHSPNPPHPLYMANAGTAMRFLTSACTLVRDGDVVLTGSNRMKERPIRDLVDSLNAYGANVDYVEKPGCPPLRIKGTGFKGGDMLLSAAVSSQFVSSVLLSAPYALEKVTLTLKEKEPVSQPYIDMTLQLMKHFGIDVQITDSQNPDLGKSYHIPQKPYTNPSVYEIEADASSATYPLAIAAITGGRVKVDAVGRTSLQGDAGFHRFLEMMGCTVTQDDFSTTVNGPAVGQLRSVEINFADMTDAFMTAAVLAAVAKGTTRITGIANQRVKECNRIAAMVTELTKCGATVAELPDGLVIEGKHPSLLHGASIHCYDDHRIAMSFAVLGCIIPGVIITDRLCVEKTYPEFWDDVQRHFNIKVIPGCDFVSESTSTTLVESENTLVHESSSSSSSSSSPSPSVILVGMRGAGKTTLGKTAARILNWAFIDVDEYMTEFVFKIPITEYVTANGWAAFRVQEEEAVRQILKSHSKNTIISMGGGVVETESLRNLLQDRSLCPFVVQVKRSIEEIVKYLEADLSRPKHAEHPKDTWERRKPWYSKACNFDFPIISNDTDPAKSGLEFANFVSRIISNKTLSPASLTLAAPVASRDSYFLSLTYPDLSDFTSDLVTVTTGADVVELRVDLLKSLTQEFIENQVAILRRYTNLPIIYTVRSKPQGGAFEGDEAAFVKLVEIGIRLGCEYIDMETCWSLSAQMNILKSKSASRIIASYHDRTEDWTDSDVITAYEDCLCKGKSDIAKVVFHATTAEQGARISSIIASHPNPHNIPYIAICTGEKGKFSRALNTYMTPVTHSALPTPAAPGQLSIKEIVVTRAMLKLTSPKNFHLFGGSSIVHSPSPTMHNTAFERYLLPFKYSILPAENSSEYASTLSDLAFGGASVTIPHKETIGAFLDVISYHAKQIGAVNTIKVLEVNGFQGKSGKNRVLFGDNTDWLALRDLICKKLGVSPQNCASSGFKALVIGAGGTARAACYTLKYLGFAVTIYNRTTEKANVLAEQFGCKVAATVEELDATPFNVVVGTVPATSSFTLPSTVYEKSKPLVVEFAYKPRETALLAGARQNGCDTVEGIELLIQQGLYQSELWTKLSAPRDMISSAVYDFASKSA